MTSRQLEVTYVRSAIGRSGRQRRTVEALGLHRLHQTVRHADNDSVRAMIKSIEHLLDWREVEEGKA
jgi:large subunit ribosomal protein L30